MAKCLVCGDTFHPTAEEERLIAARKMKSVCLQCARAAYDDADDGTLAPPLPLREPLAKLDGTKLCRAELFDRDMRLVCFTATPMLETRARLNALKRDKPLDEIEHVTTLGDDGRRRMPTEPRVVLHTNLETFQSTGADFWVKKLPMYWCPYTGVARIFVRHADVADVVRGDKDKGVEVVLRNGGRVRLSYH